MSAEHSKSKRNLRCEILSNFDLKDLQKLTEMQEPPSLAESFVDAFKTFGMGLMYSFVDPATICMLIVSCLATLLSADGFLNLSFGISMKLVGYGCVFPSIFSITAAQASRQKTFAALANFKAGLYSVYCNFKNWCDTNEMSSAEIEDDITSTVASVIIYVKSKKYSFGDMNADEELGHEMYDNMKKMWEHVDRFKKDGIKKKPLPPELSSQYNFLRMAFISMESCRVAADYRTPRGLRLFCYAVIHTSPFFLAPYFNSYCSHEDESMHKSHSWGCYSGYLMAILFVIINMTLLRVQQQLENVFDGDGHDDVNWESWTDQLAHISTYGGDEGKGKIGKPPPNFSEYRSPHSKEKRSRRISQYSGSNSEAGSPLNSSRGIAPMRFFGSGILTPKDM